MPTFDFGALQVRVDVEGNTATFASRLGSDGDFDQAGELPLQEEGYGALLVGAAGGVTDLIVVVPKGTTLSSRSHDAVKQMASEPCGIRTCLQLSATIPKGRTRVNGYLASPDAEGLLPIYRVAPGSSMVSFGPIR